MCLYEGASTREGVDSELLEEFLCKELFASQGIIYLGSHHTL